MGYWRDKYEFKYSIEYEYKFKGNYGAKGEKRAKRKKVTPEQVAKQNQINRENKMRRLIKANFSPGDPWACLKYPKGTRLPVEIVKEHLKGFLKNMRTEYKKAGILLKFIYRMEIGREGGIHIHILTNRLPEENTDILMAELWKKHGHVNFTPIYETGGYKDLAEYIVKKPDEEEYKQMSLFSVEEQKQLIKVSTSRNLIRPVPERKEYRRWTVRRLIEEGPKATPGFYIDKNSIVYGTNPYTGMSYYRYTENKIERDRRMFAAEGG